MDENKHKIMESIRPIGGYFEWEFPPQKTNSIHPDAILVNSGRHALEYILLGLRDVKKIYIPYFTCDVILQPLERLLIPYTFYYINERLEIADNIKLEDGDYILYTNYYGIKNEYVQKICNLFGSKVIIDNAQALFCPEYAKHQFYSPRKFIGMPDGGMVISTIKNYSNSLPKDKSFERCSHLLKRHELIPSEGYNDYKENSQKIAEAPLSRMSEISKGILFSIDFNYIKQKRLSNFKHLHNALGNKNKLNSILTDCLKNHTTCPLVYPFYTEQKGLKKKLIEKQIFIATYWPNVLKWCKNAGIEYNLADQIIAIPIDQRYSQVEMQKIINLIYEYEYNH